MDWIRRRAFEHEAHNRVLADYLQAVDATTERLERATKDIADLVESWSQKPLVQALQALRGVQLLTAVILVAEIGDFRRFATAPALMAYLGLVPSEYSSVYATLIIKSSTKFRPKVSEPPVACRMKPK